jgi:D-proline reductase (dithiol) PrdB
MCNRSVGLAARVIEQAGIATVSLSIVREVSEKTPAPRSLYLRFPFGHALGEPGNRGQHFAVLYLAFQLLFEADQPGTIRDGKLRWKRETYQPPHWDAFHRLGPAGR